MPVRIPSYFRDACRGYVDGTVNKRDLISASYRFCTELSRWWVARWKDRHTALEPEDFIQMGVTEISLRMGLHGDPSKWFDPSHPSGTNPEAWAANNASRAMQRGVKSALKYRKDPGAPGQWVECLPNLTVTRPEIDTDESAPSDAYRPIMEWLRESVPATGRIPHIGTSELVAARDALKIVPDPLHHRALNSVIKRLSRGMTIDECLLEAETRPELYGLERDDLDRLIRYASTERFWTVRQKWDQIQIPSKRTPAEDDSRGMILGMSLPVDPITPSETALALIPRQDPHEDIQRVITSETPAALELLVATRYDDSVNAWLELARVLYATKSLFRWIVPQTGAVLDDCPPELLPLVTDLADQHKSFKWFLHKTILTPIADDTDTKKPSRSASYALADAYEAALEIATDNDLPIDRVWREIGATKLSIVARVHDETDRDEIKTAAIDGMSCSQLNRMRAEQADAHKQLVGDTATDFAETAEILNEEPRESAPDDVTERAPAQHIEIGPDDGPEPSERVRLVLSVAPGKPIRVPAQDLTGEFDSLDGADAAQMADRVYYPARIGSVEVSFRPETRDGKLAGGTFQFEPIGVK